MVDRPSDDAERQDRSPTGPFAATRKEVEALASAGALRAIVDALPDIAHIYDRDFRWRHVNPRAAEWLRSLGRDPEKLIGRRVWDEFPELAEQPKFEAALRAAEEDREVSFETERDGRHYETRIVPYAEGVISLTRDISERTQSEMARRRLAAIVEDSDDAILSKDLDGTITSWNRGAQRIYGYTARETVGQPVSMLVPPEIENDVPAIMERLRRGERIDHYETLRKAKDGRRLHVALTISPMRDDAGEIVGASVIARDVTERRRAEEERERLIHDLKVERSRLTALFDKAPAFMAVLDGPEHTFAFANPSYYEIVGHRDLVGKPVREALPEVEGQGYFELLDAVYRSGEPHVGREARLFLQPEPDAELTEVYVNFVYEPLRNAAGEVQGIFVHGVDVTDLVDARVRAEASARRMRLLAEATAVLSGAESTDAALGDLADALVPDVAEYALTYVIEGGRLRRVGTASKDAEASRLLDHLHRYFAPSLEDDQGVGHVARTGEPLLVRDMSRAWIERRFEDDPRRSILTEIGPRSAIVAPLRARGRTLGAFAIVRTAPDAPRYDDEDLHFMVGLADRAALAIENARLYHEAEEERKAREDVLAIVSHDLRNPLGVVQTTGQLLLDVDLPDEKRRDLLSRIIRSARHATRLVSDLLDVARIDAGGFTVAAEAVDPLELMRQAVEAIQVQAGEAELELRVEEADALPAVNADVEQCARVFSNLLSNAIRHTPAGGCVTVRARPDADLVRFEVADTGPGIPPDAREHLFDRFWQARHTNRAGAGLGLAIVKGIVEAHGGAAGVDSEVGAGSTFWFTIPVAPPDAAGA